jgi:hypothetical protein
MSIQNLTEYFIKQPLTGEEIARLVGAPPIPYSNLLKYKRLEDILNHTGKPYAIILYQISQFDGHFVMLGVDFMGRPTFGDPYGYTPKYIEDLPILKYDRPYGDLITPLLEDYARRHNKQVNINTKDFQRKASGVADCGRISSLFALFTQHATFQEIERLFFSNADPWLRMDHIATMLTLLSLSNLREYFNKINKLKYN